MDFARPVDFWLLTLLPMLIAMTLRGIRRRSRGLLALGKSARWRGEKRWAWTFVLALLILAATGPRWGRLAGSSLPPGHDVILLVDVSRSMGAEDAVPNRLAAAISAANGVVDELSKIEGDRIGVVAFAGHAALKCPLTENAGAVKERLAALRPGSIQPGGTNLGNGLTAAMEAFDDQEPAEGRTIIVLSDGEDHDGAWSATIPRLREQRITVHAVAIGDAEQGRTVPIASSGNKVQEVQYEGKVVVSRRDDRALEAVREATGGVLIPMGVKSADLAELYRERIAPSEKSRRDAQRAPERVERYPAFVVAALGLILATLWPFSRRAGLLAILLAFGLGAGKADLTAADAVREGDRLYSQGEFLHAIERFEEAIGLDPGSPIPRYNAAAALFQVGRYREAETHYFEARKRADAPLRVKIDYALGNVAVAEGRYKEALDHYDACISAKVASTGLQRIKEDAIANRVFAARLIPPPPKPDDSGDGESPSRPRPKSPSDGPESEGNSASKGAGASNKSGSGKAEGGAGSAPPGGEAPEGRLDAMLNDVRNAQKSSMDAAPPPSTSSGNRKDW